CRGRSGAPLHRFPPRGQCGNPTGHGAGTARRKALRRSPSGERAVGQPTGRGHDRHCPAARFWRRLMKRRILVIEDEPEMRRNIAALLRYHACEALEAENGRKGLEVARREKPDLILCDVMMPELDGYGVLQALQQDSDLALIPFVFLTAKGDKDDWRS